MRALLACTLASAMTAAALATSPRTPATGSGRGATMHAHLVDYASMEADEIGRATTQASLIWADIGVRLTWDRGGEPRSVSDEAALDATVLVLRHDMAQRMIAAENRGPGVLGRAVPEALRAYIFYDRVRTVSERYGTLDGSVLGKVFAHELGHLLLGHNHSAAGLMRAQPDLRSTRLAFSPDDGAKIRTGILAKLADRN